MPSMSEVPTATKSQVDFSAAKTCSLKDPGVKVMMMVPLRLTGSKVSCSSTPYVSRKIVNNSVEGRLLVMRTVASETMCEP